MFLKNKITSLTTYPIFFLLVAGNKTAITFGLGDNESYLLLIKKHEKLKKIQHPSIHPHILTHIAIADTVYNLRR